MFLYLINYYLNTKINNYLLKIMFDMFVHSLLTYYNYHFNLSNPLWDEGIHTLATMLNKLQTVYVLFCLNVFKCSLLIHV